VESSRIQRKQVSSRSMFMTTIMMDAGTATSFTKRADSIIIMVIAIVILIDAI